MADLGPAAGAVRAAALACLSFPAGRPDGGPPRVVVLAPAPDAPLALAVRDDLLAAAPTASVRVLGPDDDLDEQRRHHGPAHLLVDLRRGRVVERALGLLAHLHPGGSLVSRLPDDEDRRATAGQRLAGLAELGRTAREPLPKRQRRDARPNPERDREWAAWSLATVERAEHHVVLRTRPEAVTAAKVREEQLVPLLAARPDLGEVVEQHPGERFTARGTVDSNDGGHEALPTTYDVPASSLRCYRDVVCVPGGAVLGPAASPAASPAAGLDLALPESFRRPTRRRLRHLDLADLAPGHVLVPPAVRGSTVAGGADLPVLEGGWFHLDHEIRGHFGHALTEQLAHVWGWATALAAEPDLRVLVSTGSGLPLAGWELDLLQAAGIDRDRVRVVDEVVRVERLWATTQLFDNPGHVAPRLAATWDAVGAALEARAVAADPDRDWPSRVFLTRRGGNRSCHQAPEVEAVFAAAGFTVVRPETLPLAEQVTLVRRAEAVGGFSGSGMFHLAFAERPQQVVAVGSQSYSAQNEWLFSAVRGHHLHLVECVPDVPFAGRWDQESFQSAFSYDAAREGRWLQQVLDAL